jgi:hypothetical protein
MLISVKKEKWLLLKFRYFIIILEGVFIFNLFFCLLLKEIWYLFQFQLSFSEFQIYLRRSSLLLEINKHPQ